MLKEFPMKSLFLKTFAVLALVLMTMVICPAILFGQADDSDVQKYALVIGNANYVGMSALTNPVNDANDITAVLEHLGFTVDKILNGNLEQMEDAVVRLRDRLSKADNAYGFFFYAGHGIQSGGENYLIPVNANLPTENALRNRAMSVQMLLDDLNDARNTLNVIVLDACRDNPFGWSRSGSRGLTIVSRQPAESIIVHATSAGQVASDGEGRNGLFTSQLLSNLATPGLEVNEVFRRTGQDVARASSNNQIPAIYSQFFGTAYLGEAPGEMGGIIHPPSATIIIGGGSARREKDPAQFWSLGASVGTCFVEPWVVGTARGTLAPVKNLFFALGIDFGFVSGVSDVGYNSFFPFAHAAYFVPLSEKIGVYAGAGGGYLWANYDFPEGKLSDNTFAVDVVAGINLFDTIDISYTFRTNFGNMVSKVSAGYTYRF